MVVDWLETPARRRTGIKCPVRAQSHMWASLSVATSGGDLNATVASLAPARSPAEQAPRDLVIYLIELAAATIVAATSFGFDSIAT